ncbi:methyltransferase [Brevundimonas sp.]|uniref:methyltransferase n=1 Tax=Brevundimonas sp. TaxID=1871086 RepID=UPI0025BA1926|nr:methyltransferase [Brevundimonas sp.]
MTAEPLEQAPAALRTVEAAQVELLDRLSAAGYDFVQPTPSTHARVAGRRERARPGSLRDVFGWSLPFAPGELPPALFDALLAARAVEPAGDDLLRSSLRVSSIEDRLHLHSAPGAGRDAVFLGPDSYRFVRFLRQELDRRPAFTRAVDIGVGAGAGALTLAARNPLAEVIGTDVNRGALRLFAANARHAALPVCPVEGPGLKGTAGRFDLIVANPPYIAGEGGRVYRDGGVRGIELGLRWMEESVDRLAPGGRVILYTGSPIRDGADPVRAALLDLAAARGLDLAWEEIDPDVFGGTLARPAYRDVERIAAVGAVLTAP